MTSHGVLAAAALALVALAPQQGVFRTRTDVVAIDVAVAEGRKPILTLNAADFELRDNGVVQTIEDFEREKLPLDVTITADLSGSMGPAKLASIERAVKQVGATMRDVDRSAVMTFTSVVTERRPMGPPPVTVDLSVNLRGDTSIIDALLLALVTEPLPDRRQLGLFMTDGDETTSVFDPQTALETAKFSSTQMCFVIVRDKDSGPLKNGLMLSLFRTVASTTGGEIITLKAGDDLSKAFLAAVENFRTSYVLRYSPKGVPTRGWHEVQVRTRNSKYSVRARRGYWSDGGGK